MYFLVINSNQICSKWIDSHLFFVQTADNVDKDYTILQNGQVAAQQRNSNYRQEPQLPPLRRSRSVSPPKSKGIFGNLCSRFKSPSKREKRAKSRQDQAAALAAYRDTYGESSSTSVSRACFFCLLALFTFYRLLCLLSDFTRDFFCQSGIRYCFCFTSEALAWW